MASPGAVATAYEQQEREGRSVQATLEGIHASGLAASAPLIGGHTSTSTTTETRRNRQLIETHIAALRASRGEMPPPSPIERRVTLAELMEIPQRIQFEHDMLLRLLMDDDVVLDNHVRTLLNLHKFPPAFVERFTVLVDGDDRLTKHFLLFCGLFIDAEMMCSYFLGDPKAHPPTLSRIADADAFRRWHRDVLQPRMAALFEIPWDEEHGRPLTQAETADPVLAAAETRRRMSRRFDPTLTILQQQVLQKRERVNTLVALCASDRHTVETRARILHVMDTQQLEMLIMGLRWAYISTRRPVGPNGRCRPVAWMVDPNAPRPLSSGMPPFVEGDGTSLDMRWVYAERVGRDPRRHGREAAARAEGDALGELLSYGCLDRAMAQHSSDLRDEARRLGDSATPPCAWPARMIRVSSPNRLTPEEYRADTDELEARKRARHEMRTAALAAAARAP